MKAVYDSLSQATIFTRGDEVAAVPDSKYALFDHILRDLLISRDHSNPRQPEETYGDPGDPLWYKMKEVSIEI